VQMAFGGEAPPAPAIRFRVPLPECNGPSASRSSSIAAGSSRRCGYGERCSQHGCTPSTTAGSGQVDHIFRLRSRCPDHQRRRDSGRSRLAGGQRRPVEAADDDPLAPCARGDHRADGHRGRRVLDLDQQIDIRPFCPCEKFREADQPRRQRIDLGGRILRDSRLAISRSCRITSSPSRVPWTSHSIASAPSAAAASKAAHELSACNSLLPRCAMTCGFIAPVPASPRTPATVLRSTSVAGSVNTACGNSGASARRRMACIT